MVLSNILKDDIQSLLIKTSLVLKVNYYTVNVISLFTCNMLACILYGVL